MGMGVVFDLSTLELTKSLESLICSLSCLLFCYNHSSPLIPAIGTIVGSVL